MQWTVDSRGLWPGAYFGVVLIHEQIREKYCPLRSQTIATPRDTILPVISLADVNQIYKNGKHLCMLERAAFLD